MKRKAGRKYGANQAKNTDEPLEGNTTTQVTLDDDFIVPDTMDDMEQVLLDNGEIQIESVKNQGEKVLIKGRLDFQVSTGGRKADSDIGRKHSV